MNLSFFQDKKIHFSAIGGIGMSAIAKIMCELGFDIVGSDLVEGKMVNKLKELGIDSIKTKQVSDNIDKSIGLIIRSSAIQDDNPEIIKAKELGIPIVKRAEALAALMEYKGYGIALGGTHGKTSMTAMAAAMLEAGDLDPTVINGGIINNYGTNAKFGKTEYCVVESDESDGTFVDLPAKIIVVSNIEPEHMEFYKTEDVLYNYFRKFIEQAQNQKDGLAVLCIDDQGVNKVIAQLEDSEKNIITYSIDNSNADIQAKNIKQKKDGLYFDIFLKKQNKTFENVFSPMYGRHNVLNLLSSIAIGLHLDFDEAQIREGLVNSNGAQKRFTKVGEVNGITIIDDYGHHPSEIKATIATAKSVLEHENEKVIVVFQPHKHSRVQDLFNEFCNCFGEADILIVTDIYSANYPAIEGITQDVLIEGIKATGHKNVLKLNSENELAKLIHSIAKSGDLVLCTGAGSITQWARDLPRQLKGFI